MSNGAETKTYKYNKIRLSLLEQDITNHEADIIVNSANDSLLGEDGVDGAIHIAAGSELQQECNRTGYCAVTDVVVTNAYRLPAKHIFHTVGPQWNDDDELAESLLIQTYFNNLTLGEEMKLRSIAFPSISTGQYGVPTNIGAKSFTLAIEKYGAMRPKHLRDIRMVTYYGSDFDERSDAYEQYHQHLLRLESQG